MTQRERTFPRHSVGFDTIFDAFDQFAKRAPNAGFPPFNIFKGSDEAYRIEIAVAGFSSDEIDAEVENGVLTVSAQRAEEKSEDGSYLHRGIALRSFKRRFQLADYVEVKSAELKNGLLIILLKREVPEEKKSRKIAITSSVTDAIADEAADKAA